MVLAPESLAVTLTGKFVGENRSRPNLRETSVREMDADGAVSQNSKIHGEIPCYLKKIP
jgi:hypothetical protein